MESENVFKYALEKKIIHFLLEETHVAFLRGEKNGEQNYDEERKTDAQNKIDAF